MLGAADVLDLVADGLELLQPDDHWRRVHDLDRHPDETILRARFADGSTWRVTVTPEAR